MAVTWCKCFSCGHSEYIAHMEYIAHASVMSMAAQRAGDGRTTIIIYRLRTFNSSMWGSLRLAPIIWIANVQLVYIYVGLAQARPNYVSL